MRVSGPCPAEERRAKKNQYSWCTALCPWLVAGFSKNKQRAKFYRLTAAGRRQLVAETSHWERFVRAITGVLRPAEEGP